MMKKNINITVAKLFGQQMIFDHCYYVAEQLINGDRIRVSRGFAFQADAEECAKKMARKDCGRGGKFVVIVVN